MAPGEDALQHGLELLVAADRQRTAVAGHEVDVVALAAGDGVEVQQRRSGGHGFGGGEAPGLGQQQVRGVHIPEHLVGIAQYPHPIHGAEEIALHLLIHPVVAAADGDQQILRPHELRYLLSGGTQGSGAHAAAGQREDAAIHRKIQRTAGLLPALRMQELLPNGDAGGEEPLLRQSGGHELRDQVPVGDAQSVHLQIPHTGRAGEVRGHEVGGDADAIAAAQLRHHHGGEQVDADHGIRCLIDQLLIQGADAPDALLIEQVGGVLLLPTIGLRRKFWGHSDRQSRGRG